MILNILFNQVYNAFMTKKKMSYSFTLCFWQPVFIVEDKIN